MYICCGDIAWGRDAQIAGDYKICMPRDPMLSMVEDDEKRLKELIAERLKRLTELQKLLSSWKGRLLKWSPESVIRLKHAQGILPIAEKHYRGKLKGQTIDMGPELRALEYKNIQRRLCKLKFCTGCSQADKRQFFQETDNIFSKLCPETTREEEKAILSSAGQSSSMPAVGSWYQAIFRELNSINITLFRGLIHDGRDLWLDAPGYLWASAAEPDPTQLLTPEFTALLAVAIFLGYSGSCSCPRCVQLQSKQASEINLKAKPKLAKQCSAPSGIQVKDENLGGHQQGTNLKVIEAMRKAGIEIQAYKGTGQMQTAYTNTDQLDQSMGNSTSDRYIAMKVRKMTNKAKKVSCSGCKPNFS